MLLYHCRRFNTALKFSLTENLAEGFYCSLSVAFGKASFARYFKSNIESTTIHIFGDKFEPR